MSRQVWISVSEGKHWPTPPEPSDEFEKLLWDRRNSLYAAKMAQLLGVRLKVVFGVDACTVTSSQQCAEKLVLSFDASMSPDLAGKIEKDLREFADKEWLRPTAESWDKLRKIPRAPLKWTKGVLDGTKEEEDQRPSEWQKQEQARQDKELEMAMRNQGPKLMSWGDDESTTPA